MATFKDILGHEKEIDMLKRAVKGGRVAHAYLFAGPSGIGKRRLAYTLAAALNCSLDGGGAGLFGVADDGLPCGVCEDCRLIEGKTHPNIIEVFPVDRDGKGADDGLIRVEQIRELAGALNYRVERGKKVAIVEASDKMMPAAANAFLKTLEEPPPSSVIILISARPTELLPTILSRCQRINFKPLPEGIIKGFLTGEKGFGGDDASVISRLCAGSLSSAIRYAEERVHERWGAVALGLKGLKSETFDVLKFAEELSKRDDIEDVLEFLKTWCRDKLVCLEGAGELMVNRGMDGVARGGGDRALSLIESFEMIEEARRSVMPPRYANKQLTMEALLMRLAGNGAFQ